MRGLSTILAIVSVVTVNAMHHGGMSSSSNMPAPMAFGLALKDTAVNTFFAGSQSIKYDVLVDRLHDLVPVINMTDIKIAGYKMTCCTSNCDRDVGTCASLLDPDPMMEFQRSCMQRALKSIPRNGCMTQEMSQCIMEKVAESYNVVFDPENFADSVKEVLEAHFEAKVSNGGVRSALLDGINKVCVVPTRNTQDQMMCFCKCMMDQCMFAMAAQ